MGGRWRQHSAVKGWCLGAVAVILWRQRYRRSEHREQLPRHGRTGTTGVETIIPGRVRSGSTRLKCVSYETTLRRPADWRINQPVRNAIPGLPLPAGFNGGSGDQRTIGPDSSGPGGRGIITPAESRLSLAKPRRALIPASARKPSTFQPRPYFRMPGDYLADALSGSVWAAIHPEPGERFLPLSLSLSDILTM
jgi:hypothetical protein